MNFNKNIGMILLAVYLIAVGLTGAFPINFGAVTYLIAGFAGMLILIGK